jgi:hypothetical protein
MHWPIRLGEEEVDVEIVLAEEDLIGVNWPVVAAATAGLAREPMLFVLPIYVQGQA